MKKLQLVLVLALLLGLASACKQREKCPAYGKKLPNTQKTVSNS